VIGAPLVLLAGGVLLAGLPGGASRAFRAGLPVVGLASLALAMRAAFTEGDGSRALAVVAALLGLTLSVACVGDASFGGLGGIRLRLARGAPSWISGAAVWALGSAELTGALAGLAACALLTTLAAGSARGSEAALASWRLLRLQAMAVASALLGAFLVGPGRAGPGAGVVLLGVAVLAGLAPFGGAAAEAEARAEAAFAPFVAALLPFTALVVLLRARLLLVEAGEAGVVDGLLLASGLLAMVLGAASAWSDPLRSRREAAAGAGLFGVAVFGFGLGDAGGLHAGLVALLAVSFAVPARVLARRFEAGRVGGLSVLAATALPPGGLFAGCAMVIDRTASNRPLLLVPLLVALGLLLGGLLRRDKAVRPPATRAVRGVLLVHLAIAGAIGLAMPGIVSDRLVDAAEFLSGDASP
jgi:hypothetical protein